jgi:hypothetical protein
MMIVQFIKLNQFAKTWGLFIVVWVLITGRFKISTF